MKFEDEDDACIWILENQMGKRNLTDKQRAKFIQELHDLRIKKHGGGRGNQHTKVPSDNSCHLAKDKTRSKIAAEHSISEGTVQNNVAFGRAVNTLAENTGVSQDEIMNLPIGMSDTTQLAEATPEQQREVIAKNDKKAIVAAYKEIQSEIREKKREEKQANIDNLRKQESKMPDGTFHCIVIDPPWNYGTQYDADGRRVANPYPEMSQEKLKELDIRAKDDCVMFLWTTQRFIWDAKELLQHWGFEYRATMVWDKEKIGMGDLLRMQCEFCLMGIKGKPRLNNPQNIRDIIREARREHSRKPEAFYDIVETLCPYKKMEYFAREQREGYEVYGNDTEKF
jgi:N6-adenosine-specific RNA methylase IME4